MKFQIKKELFLNILSILEKSLSSRVIIESLKGIKIDVSNDSIIFSASKSDLSLQYTLALNEDIEIKNTGSVLVNGTQLINIIKRLDDETISLIKEKNSLEIKTLNSKIKLNLYDISTYPNFNFPENENLNDIDKNILKEIYSKTKYSTSKNSANLILNGIHINFNKENTIATSTDTRRLTFLKLDPVPNYENEITISSYLFSDLVKIFDLLPEHLISISNSNRQLYIETSTLKIKARLLDGDFPDAEKIIPYDFNFSITLNSSKLANSLEKIKYISENSSVVTMNYINSSLLIKFFDFESGGIEDKLFVEDLSGDPFEIAFDPEFVINSLQSLKEEYVKIQFVSEISAFLITGKDSSDNLQIISPIRMG